MQHYTAWLFNYLLSNNTGILAGIFLCMLLLLFVHTTNKYVQQRRSVRYEK